MTNLLVTVLSFLGVIAVGCLVQVVEDYVNKKDVKYDTIKRQLAEKQPLALPTATIAIAEEKKKQAALMPPSYTAADMQEVEDFLLRKKELRA